MKIKEELVGIGPCAYDAMQLQEDADDERH